MTKMQEKTDNADRVRRKLRDGIQREGGKKETWESSTEETAHRKQIFLDESSKKFS